MDTFASMEMENRFCQRLMEQLEIRYARFPPREKRGHSSRADNIPKVNRRRSAPLDDPDEQDEGPGPAVDCDSAGGVGGAGPLLVNE